MSGLATHTHLPLFGHHHQTWLEYRDGNEQVRQIFDRHYSRNARSTHKLFVGPGEKMILMTLDQTAIWVWRKCKFFKEAHGAKGGVNCAVFRNEGTRRSSDLIREAVKIAREKWPGERLFTYVDAGKIKSRNPGCCFKKAGWKRVGKTKAGLIVLELTP